LDSFFFGCVVGKVGVLRRQRERERERERDAAYFSDLGLGFEDLGTMQESSE
jgi:hypothetical protein